MGFTSKRLRRNKRIRHKENVLQDLQEHDESDNTTKKSPPQSLHPGSRRGGRRSRYNSNPQFILLKIFAYGLVMIAIKFMKKHKVQQDSSTIVVTETTHPADVEDLNIDGGNEQDSTMLSDVTELMKDNENLKSIHTDETMEESEL